MAWVLAPALVAMVAALASTAPAARAQSPAAPGIDRFLRGQAAVDQLALSVPAQARGADLEPATLGQLFLQDPTLALSPDGELVYFDLLAPDSAPATNPGDAVATAPPVDAPEFQLATNPGAAHTIYLDFDGHTTVGTSWNTSVGVDTIVSPPYDVDLGPDTWSPYELAIVGAVWQRVAEDYAPWNVNVTTADPGPEALRYSGPGDAAWGVRAVITTDTFLGCACGGAAFVGAFDDPADEPVFVFNNDSIGVSEAASHEVGHALNLAHDGTTGEEYYLGHSGGGVPGWAPIMGAAYYDTVSQWSQQEYRNANNNTASANFGNGPDDVAIIGSLTNGNGFGLRPDDHGDTPATATALAVTDGSFTASGVIGTRADVDAFAFTTSGGEVLMQVTPAPDRPNLDLAFTLRAADGTLVRDADQPSSLGAGLLVTLRAGTYTVEVAGVGAGSPGDEQPTGYSDYASLGHYTLDATVTDIGPGATIASVVRDPGGRPVSGVSVGLFRASGTERLDWQRDALSGADGRVSFDFVGPGCYLLTFVAPGDQVFVAGSRYLNSETVCVAGGDDVTVAGATLVELTATGTIKGRARTTDGEPVADVAVGVFQAAGDGSRGAWLRDTVTGADGGFSVSQAPGCYRLTFSTTSTTVFVDSSSSGGSYHTTEPICVAAGETVDGVDATLLSVYSATAIYGTLSVGDGSSPSDLAIGLFQANPDGSRGPWVRDTISRGDGSYEFMYLVPGCYVLTVSAPLPNDQPYQSTGPLCADPGPGLGGVDIVVGGTSPNGVLTGWVRTSTGPVPPEVAIGVFQATGDGSRGAWLRDIASSTFNGEYVVRLPVGCYVLTFTAPEGLLFVTGGSYLSSGAQCLGPDDVRSLDVVLVPVGAGGNVSGTVRTSGGAPVPGASIGLFVDNDGARGEWLRDTVTGADGTYRFADVGHDCHQVTLVAPAGTTFSNGASFVTYDRLCALTDNLDITGLDATVNSP